MFKKMNVSCWTEHARARMQMKFQLLLSKKYPILLFLIAFLGGSLRIYDLGSKSLWFDEFLSLRDSQSFDVAINANHPPLFFIILRFFRYMSEIEFFLRLPSAIFGILAILLIYEVGKLFFGAREGLFAAFLLSISTFQIYYSQEARMYTLFTFLSLMSLFFFYKATKENKKGPWLGFVFFTLLNLYTHYFAIFVVLVETVSFVMMVIINQISRNKGEIPFKRTFLVFVLSLIAIFVLYFPRFFQKGLTSSEEIVGAVPVWMKEKLELSPFLTVLLSEFSTYESIALYLYLFFFLCGAIACIKNVKGILLLSWIALPITLFFLLSNYVKPIISIQTIRYAIFIQPTYLLLVSSGVFNIINRLQKINFQSNKKSKKIRRSKKINQLSLLLIIVIVILFSYVNIASLQAHYDEKKEDWRALGQFLKTHSQSGDIIVIEPPGVMRCLLYYYADVTNYQEVISTRPYPNTNSTILHYASSENTITIVSSRGKLDTLKDICSKNDRVWVVSSVHYAKTTIKKWIYDNLPLVKEFSRGIRLHLIQPVSFNAAIFGHFEWNAQIPWEKFLRLVGASIATFNDTTVISDIDFSEFDVVVFADFRRRLDDVERLHLEESVQNGSTVIISGLSPYWLAASIIGGPGSTTNITKISSWFGAAVFSEAPRTEKWKVKFTENAIETMQELDLEDEYAFYTKYDWSTPTGCIVQPASVVYAYRVNDEAATIFIHEFGKGKSIFIGPRFGFDSPDAETFNAFLKSLILSSL